MPDFDITKPPTAITNPTATLPPNVYQEFPRHLHKPDGSFVEVSNADDKATKLAEGWNLTPGPQPEPTADVEPDDAAPRRKGKAA